MSGPELPAVPPAPPPALGTPAATARPVGPAHRRNTPGPGGYVAAAFIALGIGSILVAIAVYRGEGMADIFPLILVVLIVGFFVMLLVGFPLTLVAHLAVRRFRRQSVHIAAFGLVGVLTGAVVCRWLGYGFDDGVWIMLAVGASASGGRASVNRRPR